MAKPTPLAKHEIVNICLKRFAGVTQKRLASSYNSSVDRMLATQRKHATITNWLTPNSDGEYILNQSLHAYKAEQGEFVTAVLNGEFVYNQLEITHKFEDGVLICNSVWRQERTKPEELTGTTFGVEDRGQPIGKTKIGFLIIMDRDMVDGSSVALRGKPKGAVLATGSMLNNDTKWNDGMENGEISWHVCEISKTPKLPCLVGLSKTLETLFEKAVIDLEESGVLPTKKTLDRIELEFEVESETADDVKGVATLNPSAGTPPTVELYPCEEKPEYVWNASNSFIAISLGRETWNANADHPDFKKALQCLFNDDIQGAVNLINVEKAITKYVDGAIHIEDGILKFNGYVLNNGLTKRILERMQKGEDFEFFIPFLNNLMENPSEKTVGRLFDFLEANDIEITDDGHFLAWKKVGANFMDIYKGEFDNTPNGPNPPRMPRNQVDEDDNVTCSRGLHVCSKSYLGSYGSCNGNRVVVCKVHPRDVVAVPHDYNNAKMRTCGYTVIREATQSDLT